MAHSVLVVAEEDTERLTFSIAGDRRFEIAGEATSGHEALTLIETISFDVAVIDLRLVEIGGYEVLRAASQRRPRASVIAISPTGRLDRVAAILRAGAKASIHLSAVEQDLPLALDACLRGERFISSCQTSWIRTFTSLALRRLRVETDAGEALASEILTPREQDALILTAMRLTAEEVAALLGIEKRAVEDLRCRTIRKLELSTNDDLVHFFSDHGHRSLPVGDTGDAAARRALLRPNEWRSGSPGMSRLAARAAATSS